MTLALDGSASASTAKTGAASLAVSLTTAQTSDVILLFATVAACSGAPAPTVSDTAGLDWHLRESHIDDSHGIRLYEFYATSAAVLSADSITFALNSGTAQITVHVFGVNGVPAASLSNPFDAAFPVKTSGYGTPAYALSAAVVPSTTNCFLVAGGADNWPENVGNDLLMTAGTNYTLIKATRILGDATYGGCGLGTEYRLSNASQTMSINQPASGPSSYWLMIADAITSDNPGPASPHFKTLRRNQRLTSLPKGRARRFGQFGVHGGVQQRKPPPFRVKHRTTPLPKGRTKRFGRTPREGVTSRRGPPVAVTKKRKRTPLPKGRVTRINKPSKDIPDPPTFDGAASANSGVASSLGVTLSTTRLFDVVILSVNYDRASTVGVTSPTLTWARRKGPITSSTGAVSEEWYAKASAKLTSEVITATFSPSAKIGLRACAIADADFTNPFDPNASLPASTTSSGSPPTITGISTTFQSGLVLVFGTDESTTRQSVGSIGGVPATTEFFNTTNINYYFEARQTTSILTNASANFVNATAGTGVLIADVVTAGKVGVPRGIEVRKFRPQLRKGKVRQAKKTPRMGAVAKAEPLSKMGARRRLPFMPRGRRRRPVAPRVGAIAGPQQFTTARKSRLRAQPIQGKVVRFGRTPRQVAVVPVSIPGQRAVRKKKRPSTPFAHGKVTRIGRIRGSYERRFGFGFVDVNGLLSGASPYAATQFYNGMFKTPPYPSTWMAGLIANSSGDSDIGCFSTSGNNVKFLKSIMDSIVADGLDVKIVVMVGIDLSYQDMVDAVENLVNYLNGLSSRSAIGGFGWRCEQTSVLTPGGTPAATWDATFAQIRAAVTAAGWPTVNYYPGGFKGTSAEATLEGWTAHTNFPQADPITTLDATTGSWGGYIGITIGTDGPYYFVDSSGNLQTNLGCGWSGWPGWQDEAMANGYIPPTYPPDPYGAVACANSQGSGWPPIIDEVLSRGGNILAKYRQWSFLIAGNNSTGYYSTGNPLNFLGVSGKTTHFLWDSATFRNFMAAWLALNPGVYIQSMEEVVADVAPFERSFRVKRRPKALPRGRSRKFGKTPRVGVVTRPEPHLELKTRRRQLLPTRGKKRRGPTPKPATILPATRIFPQMRRPRKPLNIQRGKTMRSPVPKTPATRVMPQPRRRRKLSRLPRGRSKWAQVPKTPPSAPPTRFPILRLGKRRLPAPTKAKKTRPARVPRSPPVPPPTRFPVRRISKHRLLSPTKRKTEFLKVPRPSLVAPPARFPILRISKRSHPAAPAKAKRAVPVKVPRTGVETRPAPHETLRKRRRQLLPTRGKGEPSRVRRMPSTWKIPVQKVKAMVRSPEVVTAQLTSPQKVVAKLKGPEAVARSLEEAEK